MEAEPELAELAELDAQTAVSFDRASFSWSIEVGDLMKNMIMAKDIS